MSEVPEQVKFQLLPYSRVVGQATLRKLLEVAYVMDSSVGGVLISGERGTAKSTIVRSFASMVYGQLPVTLPMNATDDRVIGGWQIDALMRGDPKWQSGLLEKAGNAGMLYIDEVNLLDDHIINLILDVASTGLLVIEREGMNRQQVDVSFTLVGTMNPEEGSLRPQLLDRFGLFVPIAAEQEPAKRREILLTVLQFDTERRQAHSQWLAEGARRDAQLRAKLGRARQDLPRVQLDDRTIDLCARVASAFDVIGHRGEIVIARGAVAAAALAGRDTPTPDDVRLIAPHAVIHRRRDAVYTSTFEWTPKDEELLEEVTAGERGR